MSINIFFYPLYFLKFNGYIWRLNQVQAWFFFLCKTTSWVVLRAFLRGHMVFLLFWNVIRHWWPLPEPFNRAGLKRVICYHFLLLLCLCIPMYYYTHTHTHTEVFSSSTIWIARNTVHVEKAEQMLCVPLPCPKFQSNKSNSWNPLSWQMNFNIIMNSCI